MWAGRESSSSITKFTKRVKKIIMTVGLIKIMVIEVSTVFDINSISLDMTKSMETGGLSKTYWTEIIYKSISKYVY